MNRAAMKVRLRMDLEERTHRPTLRRVFATIAPNSHPKITPDSDARQIAAFGYMALAIDGPMAGQSSGGPKDENQAWISVDTGPEYGYLYHYAYAGMRGLTLLEELSGIPGNPCRIDASRLGVLGASMGGILTSIVNGIDDRVKAAVVLAAAGQWQHSMRFPKSWLYHGLYTGTRDQPYDGKDPLNSIEDIETDPTAITFMNYFDPIRYAPRQHAPVLVVVGTHDGYFPLTCANQMAHLPHWMHLASLRQTRHLREGVLEAAGGLHRGVGIARLPLVVSWFCLW